MTLAREIFDLVKEHHGGVLMVLFMSLLVIAASPVLILYAVIPAFFNPYFYVGVVTSLIAYIVFFM